jgi:hypothetical protein
MTAVEAPTSTTSDLNESKAVLVRHLLMSITTGGWTFFKAALQTRQRVLKCRFSVKV